MDALVNEAKGQMEKTIDAFKGRLNKLRTGRANPQMLDGIKCDYYGDKMDITSLCSISMPEPRQLLIKPYSREDLKSIASRLRLPILASILKWKPAISVLLFHLLQKT